MRQKVIAATIVTLVALFAGAAHMVQAQTATAGELRGQLQAKYDIVALQQGIGLVPKQPNPRARMIEVIDGNVTVDGMTVTAAQLRDRIGADAGPIVQLTYLSAVEQRQLASPEAAPASTPGTATAAPAAGSTPPPPAAPSTEPAPGTVTRDDVVHIGGSPVTVKQNERVRGDVVSLGGPIDIDGEVTGDVVGVMGSVKLGPHAVVRGDVTAVGGQLTRDAQAQVFGKINEVGGGRAQGGTQGGPRIPSARQVFFGTFGQRVATLATTVTRILLFVLFVLIVMAVGRRPVEQIAARVVAEPLRAGLVGLLAEILFVPVVCVTIVALVVSIIGIPLLVLVPFGIMLAGVVMLVGFTASAYIAGGWALDRVGRTVRNSYATVATGVVIIAGITLLARLASLALGGFGIPLTVVGYMVEYLAWTIGFGAAILAWMKMRREGQSIQPPPTTASAS
jgi:hypothetical protein